MPIASRNQNLKVFPGIRVIIGGNLKSEFKKILCFWLLQKYPMHSLQEHTTNVRHQFCKLDIFNLIKCFLSYSFCIDISNNMDIQSLKIIITYKAVKK